MLPPVSLRTFYIVALILAVFIGGSVGTSNGLVLCIDADGHFKVEAPHIRHAHSHADGADHAPHDRNSDADHGDLHRLMETCSDSSITVQKLERWSADFVATQLHLAGLHLCLPACLATGLQPAGIGAPTFRGGTAHPDLASLRSVVLLV